MRRFSGDIAPYTRGGGKFSEPSGKALGDHGLCGGAAGGRNPICPANLSFAKRAAVIFAGVQMNAARAESPQGGARIAFLDVHVKSIDHQRNGWVGGRVHDICAIRTKVEDIGFETIERF